MLIEMQKNLKIELCCSPVSEVLRSTTKCIRRSYLTLAESERVNSLAAAPRGGRRCPGPIAVLEPPFLRPMAVTCLLLKATTSASPFQLRSVAAGHRRRRSPIITSGLVAASPPRVNEHARQHGRRQLSRRRHLPASGTAAGEARTAEAAACGLILQGEGCIQWFQNALHEGDD
jgi:hypothetical protein